MNWDAVMASQAAAPVSIILAAPYALTADSQKSSCLEVKPVCYAHGMLLSVGIPRRWPISKTVVGPSCKAYFDAV